MPYVHLTARSDQGTHFTKSNFHSQKKLVFLSRNKLLLITEVIFDCVFVFFMLRKETHRNDFTINILSAYFGLGDKFLFDSEKVTIAAASEIIQNSFKV